MQTPQRYPAMVTHPAKRSMRRNDLRVSDAIAASTPLFPSPRPTRPARSAPLTTTRTATQLCMPLSKGQTKRWCQWRVAIAEISILSSLAQGFPRPLLFSLIWCLIIAFNLASTLQEDWRIFPFCHVFCTWHIFQAEPCFIFLPLGEILNNARKIWCWKVTDNLLKTNTE